MKVFEKMQVLKDGKVILNNAKSLRNPLRMMKGLMFSTKIKAPLVFCFRHEKRLSFHMFFVFYTIDAVFLDKNKKVTEIKESFRPFTAYQTKNKAIFVIEAEQGFVKKNRIKEGDVLQFKKA